MSRKTDLESHIRKSDKLITEYELIIQHSADPKEKARSSAEIASQRKLIKGYLRDYARLLKGVGFTVPTDIQQIAAASGVTLPASASPGTSSEPVAVGESSRPVGSAVQPAEIEVPPAPPTSHALVIGVGAYQRVRPLAKTTTDARDLYDLLMQCGYGQDNCVLLLESAASKGAINNALDRLARRVRPGDTVLVFFAGHGAQRIGGFEPGEYLCPVETDWYNLRGTAISNQEFTTALRAIQAGRLVVFLDACHAGGVGEPRDVEGGIKAGLSDTAYTQMAAGKGRVVIASCKPDEVSWEMGGMRNGLFTHHLLEGLRGAAAATDGCVHIFDLFKYVATEVPKRMAQHPLFKGEVENDFVITCVPQGETP